MGPTDDDGLIGPLGADARRIFNKHLEDNSEDYRRLYGLRKKVQFLTRVLQTPADHFRQARENSQGDGHFNKQRASTWRGWTDESTMGM